MVGWHFMAFPWGFYRQGYGGQCLAQKWASWAPQVSPQRSVPGGAPRIRFAATHGLPSGSAAPRILYDGPAKSSIAPNTILPPWRVYEIFQKLEYMLPSDFPTPQ